MAALHEALKSLGPLDIVDVPLDYPKPFLSDAFRKGQLLVDSVPISATSELSRERPRASSFASSASEISLSTARSTPPPSEVETLQREWKQVKMSPKDNPLGISVYKLGGKDGKGSWFARRSVHEGLGFTKWKKGLEREFPETMKVQGGPGEGNIRGIGGERRVEYKNVGGVGKLEVYLLSAQFPGPTTPRDFVTMLITSDQALSNRSGGGEGVPRHFMVISRPCNHPDAPIRDGFIRGQYESVEFIREIPIYKAPEKSVSTTNLPATRTRASSTLSKDAILRNAKKAQTPPNSEIGLPASKGVELQDRKQGSGRARGKTISFDKSRGSDAKGEDVDIPREDDIDECNPIEWIMITRSDPGGSVPRFMIERGTPGGIITDASKFLDWACAKDIVDPEVAGEFQPEEEEDQTLQKYDHSLLHDHNRRLHDYQANGHLAGVKEAATPTLEVSENYATRDSIDQAEGEVNGGLYSMVAGVAGAASDFLVSHTPAIISRSLAYPIDAEMAESPHRESTSSLSSISSTGSFASALENYSSGSADDAFSTRSTQSLTNTKALALRDRLDEKKRRIDEKLMKTREKELSKKSEDDAKGNAIRKAEERYEKEKRRQEQKYEKEIEKMERKREKNHRKAVDRRRKIAEKDEKARTVREIEELKAEVSVLRKEREALRGQVGDLQAENTSLALRVGRLGTQGQDVLKEVRADVGKSSRMRASSLKGLARVPSYRGSGNGEVKPAVNVANVLPGTSTDS